ncbi:hypothetical protein PGT21_004164 [Puccinia graminis f. sp. tritici]|uniref:HAT C-terminal dimerisation domain-containing protein n=1 Tax=Puccinia graminis f. sp. tritici TaxID=56615 RepID=A0A5B0NN01_PUCGR|nr:hypothetical protein PGT21_004164 [Puccinia graminis f. sp. tritici]KAA1090183.1 hypothetical protein PGTUg99_036875 [Puccinia graminis f. sp. tritici]
MASQTPKSTQNDPSGDKNTEGYSTDHSQTQQRRSSRASSLVIAPNMMAPSSDSRVRLTRPAPHKCPAEAEPSSNSESAVEIQSRSEDNGESESEAPPSKSKPKKKKQRQQTTSAKKKTTTPASKKKGNSKKVTSVGKEQDPAHDYEQDTDEGSVEIKPRGQKRKKAIEFPIEDFFFPPTWKAGDPEGVNLNFKCRWCKFIYRGHEHTNGNLVCHRDGFTQAGKSDRGCANREQAKKSGIKLPPSVAELRQLGAIPAKQKGISEFLQTQPIFVNRVLNQLIMIWQIRQALPWSRIEDPYLRAAFQYANRKSILYGRRWSADESKKLYSMLKRHVFDKLNSLDTKFSLVHDVWTTKGNRFVFIGAAIAYINPNWQYVLRHLTLKMIPWKHAAQTTDSGSNNNTMATAMYALLYKQSGATGTRTQDPEHQSDESGWNPTSMHVRCFCHKLALIVNAGLKALLVKTLPPAKTKRSVLGFFPVLGQLIEEEEEPESPEKGPPAAHLEEYDAGSESDYGNADEETSEDDGDNHGDSEPESQEKSPTGKHIKSTRLVELTQKLDSVIKQITWSAAQRSNFEQTAEKLKVKVAPLIAGYGIRWNIRYQSYQKAIDARVVIDHILKEDQETNQAGQFDDVLFTPRDWKEIDNLNAELEMEGDSATGTHVIPKYLELKENLDEKIKTSTESDSLYPMYQAMFKRVDKYLDEAMQCETLVLATMMHPCFRLHLFELVFGANSPEVTNSLKLLKRKYLDTEAQQKQLASLKNPIDPEVVIIEKLPNPLPVGTSLMSRLASQITAQPPKESNEVQAYLTADLSFKEGAIDDKKTPLLWWKANQEAYPTLAVMARAYLGTPASSCSVERLFSAAADVCSISRGRMLPSTMSHCVSSLMWLREEVPLTGDFCEAGKALSSLIPNPKN